MSEDPVGTAEREQLRSFGEYDQVAEAGHAVAAAEDAVRHNDISEDDTERAERCARWNADVDAAERGDETTEG